MVVKVVRSLEPQTFLEYKRRQTDLSQRDLAELYRAAGGKRDNGTVGAWLRGEREPGAHQTYLLCQIINEHLPEGADLIPEVPFYVAPSGNGAGAKVAKIKRVSDHNAWSGQTSSEQEELVA